MSDWGRVKSLNYHRTGEERVLVGIKGKDGYLYVNLYKDGKKKHCYVHRLVAEAFIANPNWLPCINHKDETRDNNIVSNLEWCDVAYNHNYGTHNERVAKALSKPVYQYTLDGSLVKSYLSANEAKRKTGYDQGHISACCRGEHKHAYGFIWSYSLVAQRGMLF